MLNDLAPGIIAAVAALAGVIVSQAFVLIQSAIERKHKRLVLLRTKYEEMTECLNQSLDWVTAAGGSTSFDQLKAHSIPTQARKCFALCLLYFPELEPFAYRLLGAIASHHGLLVDSFSSSLPLSAAAQAVRKVPQEIAASHRAIAAAREQFDDAIRLHAHKYAAA